MYLTENGRPMHSHQLYRRLGLDPKRHLPDEGVPTTLVDGVGVYVLAKGEPSPSRRQRGHVIGEKWPDRPMRRMMKRTFAICPTCGKHVEAGHLFQHTRIHEEG